MKAVKTLTALALALCMLMTAIPMSAAASGKGDYDQDNRVDTNDVRKMMNDVINASGSITLTEMLWGDMDLDSKLETSDARDLLTKLMTDDLDGVADFDYAKPTATDWWGENTVAVLGDSISFGVGTSNDNNGIGSTAEDLAALTGGIPEYSYVSFVKRAVQNANGGLMNYGFTSAYPTAWPGVARSEEIHTWPDRSTDSNGKVAWYCDSDLNTDTLKVDDGNRLMSIAMISVTPWATMTYELRKEYYQDYNYFCVYYDSMADTGSFCIADGNKGEVADVHGSKSYVPTNGTTRETKRTAFYRLADCPKDDNGIPKIIICHDGTTKPVIITGIGYYKKLPQENNGDGYITFNSFTRGGASFINLSETVLAQAASADTLIMGLGYNDFCFNHARVNAGEFEAQVTKLIALCKQNGTNVIVNDYAWENSVVSDNWVTSQRTAHAIVKAQLKRLASETNGVYIDQQAIWGDAVIASLNDANEISGKAGDNVHPNLAGHRMMAEAVVAALGLSKYWTEDWV